MSKPINIRAVPLKAETGILAGSPGTDSLTYGAATKKPPKFPKRVVLGEGYPWAMGTGPYREVALRYVRVGGVNMELAWPDELWAEDVPRYRLVLERVK